MHAAIVKGRPFGIVSFHRHMAGRHVADADHGQVANLAFGDKPPYIFVISRISIEKIDCNEAVAGLDLAHQLPLGGHVGGKRFFRQHELAARQSLADLLRPRVCQGEEADHINGGIGEDRIGSFVDGSPRDILPCELPGRRADVVHRRDFPKLALLEGSDKSANPCVRTLESPP
jgi:hypothetical protein